MSPLVLLEADQVASSHHTWILIVQGGIVAATWAAMVSLGQQGYLEVDQPWCSSLTLF